MGGYSCLRKFKETIAKGKEAYGQITIPNTYAGKSPGDETGDTSANIVPEIFFGYYCPNGIDIGIRVGYGGKWRVFCYGNDGICIPNLGQDGPFLNSIGPGNLVYMKTWIEKVGSKYYANINVSKTGYTDKDLMSSPFKTEVTSGFGSTTLSSGSVINREMTIAANPPSYETSGCYMTNAKFGPCGVVTPGNVTYVWRDSNSQVFSGSTAVAGASGAKVLQLRKDGGTYISTRIKVVGVTDPTGGATETVSIDFRPTPII